jgi:hypothetical protein
MAASSTVDKTPFSVDFLTFSFFSFFLFLSLSFSFFLFLSLAFSCFLLLSLAFSCFLFLFIMCILARRGRDCHIANFWRYFRAGQSTAALKSHFPDVPEVRRRGERKAMRGCRPLTYSIS